MCFSMVPEPMQCFELTPKRDKIYFGQRGDNLLMSQSNIVYYSTTALDLDHKASDSVVASILRGRTTSARFWMLGGVCSDVAFHACLTRHFVLPESAKLLTEPMAQRSRSQHGRKSASFGIVISLFAFVAVVSVCVVSLSVQKPSALHYFPTLLQTTHTVLPQFPSKYWKVKCGYVYFISQRKHM